MDTSSFNTYGKWHCSFPKDINDATDPRIEELAKRFDVKGARVLELGCLEGMHSLILQKLGAKEVIAIEGREDNFKKCLIVKNVLTLDRCKFLLGDLNDVMPQLSGEFDLCLALGILYHLDDSVEVIYRIAKMASRIFVWSHYAILEFPYGQISEIRYNGRVYRGKHVTEDTDHYLSGLDKMSFWLLEEDLIKVVRDAGFNKIDIISKEKHEHGPAITFLAQK
jgi:SAM-dependent methyltransferase